MKMYISVEYFLFFAAPKFVYSEIIRNSGYAEITPSRQKRNEFLCFVLNFLYLCRGNHLNGMDYDILKSVSQGSDGAQDAENSRIEAITDELRRRCELYETQRGTGQAHVTPLL